MMNAKYKEVFNKIFEPIGKFCIKLGLTPNQLTLLGLAFGVITCFVYARTQNVLLFAVLIIACALFDAVDGVVARMSGRVTKFGSYLDALCDRFFEGFGFLTVAYVTGYWIQINLIIIGSFAISYAKARAAIEVSINNLEWPDLMEKAERDILFILALIISEVTRIEIAGHDLFYWALIPLNIAIYYTVIQRGIRAKGYINSRS